MAIFRRFIEDLSTTYVPSIWRRRADNILNITTLVFCEAMDAVAESLYEYVEAWPARHQHRVAHQVSGRPCPEVHVVDLRGEPCMASPSGSSSSGVWSAARPCRPSPATGDRR